MGLARAAGADEKNVPAPIHSSWLDPNKIREMTIVGSKKMIVYNDIEPQEKIKIYDKRVDVPPHTTPSPSFSIPTTTATVTVRI
jgi:hypothetical protein